MKLTRERIREFIGESRNWHLVVDCECSGCTEMRQIMEAIWDEATQSVTQEIKAYLFEETEKKTE